MKTLEGTSAPVQDIRESTSSVPTALSYAWLAPAKRGRKTQISPGSMHTVLVSSDRGVERPTWQERLNRTASFREGEALSELIASVTR